MGSAFVRWGAWYGDEDYELTFPDEWQVRCFPPVDGPDIGDGGVVAAFDSPIGSPRLRDLARGRRAPVIAVDDLSRPTVAQRLLPPVLAELAMAGIAPEDVTILGALANHRPMTRADWEKKVGAEMMSRCQIRSHFSWHGNRPVGVTTRGTPLEMNAMFLDADLKILVGSIVPHPATGFAGGAKMVLPALCSIDSAEAFHRGVAVSGRFGRHASEARADANDAARTVGVDFIVNSIPNSQRQIAGLVTGDVVAAHDVGVAMARDVFATDVPDECDIAVLSCYPKDNEFTQYTPAFSIYSSAPSSFVREGGTIVLAIAASEGMGFHSLFGDGMRLGGRFPTKVRGRRLIFFSPNVTMGDIDRSQRSDVILHGSWSDTVEWLAARHGPHPSVAVFPCASMQLARSGS